MPATFILNPITYYIYRNKFCEVLNYILCTIQNLKFLMFIQFD